MIEKEATRHGVDRTRAREELVLALLLAGKSVTEICQKVPISRSSVWRLRRCADFQARLKQARQHAFDAAVNALHNNSLTFVETLRAVCEDPKARGSERATAARSGLDTLIRAIETFDLEARVRQLEQIAASDAEKANKMQTHGEY